MTIFGPDISSFQNGLDLSRLAAASFVIAKTTEGTYYTDRDYQGWRQQAARLGKPFVWYHFLSGEDVHAQAAHTLANVGNTALPGMLDFEPTGTFRPTLAQAVAYIDAARTAGLHLRLVYLPRWYWQQLGSPDLTALKTRGLSLVSSAYPGGSGSPAQLYPGDGAQGWAGYGGMTPTFYQFTDKATDGGQQLDYNAFKGTLAVLTLLLGTATPTPAPAPTSTGGTDVALTQQDIDAVVTAIFTHPIPRGGTIGGTTNLGAVASWSDEHVADILAAVAKPPVVDAQALAASVVAGVLPHLPAAVDAVAFADAVATAVTSHVSGQVVDYQVLADTVSHALATRLAS